MARLTRSKRKKRRSGEGVSRAAMTWLHHNLHTLSPLILQHSNKNDNTVVPMVHLSDSFFKAKSSFA